MWKDILNQHKQDVQKRTLEDFLTEEYTLPKKITNDYIIDSSRYTMHYKGQEYELQRVPFKVLEVIYNNRGRVVTRDEIYDYVWGPDIVVVRQSIEVQILKIRKTIPNAPLISKKRVGYIWEY
jgi:DNA-binding response OmpR family regulator